MHKSSSWVNGSGTASASGRPICGGLLSMLKVKVLEICSPDHRCTPISGMK
uniref:Uncharacterized protein n=1 Tax=Oryza sativa subsp. japonica TaxID=39947 RepID=Q7F244_ORYSJ|nr:hypothetical protein [Oryza sativa Japonica Group]